MGFFDSLKKRSAKGLPSIKAGGSAFGGKKHNSSVQPIVSDIHVPDQKSNADKHTIPVTSRAYSVILNPKISEKSAIAEALGSYTFVVEKNATKSMVKQAVRDLYGVVPVSVRITNMPGKSVRAGRLYGRRSDSKKAIVTLAKGQSIGLHEGV